jgi:hypothetical protein
VHVVRDGLDPLGELHRVGDEVPLHAEACNAQYDAVKVDLTWNKHA